MKKKIVIFGTGEIGSLAKFYFTHDSQYEVVAFTADDEFVDTTTFENLPLIPFSEVVNKYPPTSFDMHVALSYRKLNQIREEKYHKAKNAGYKLVNYISSKSVTWPDLVIGDNCFILENMTIQPGVKIGNNVMLWSGNHIGHSSVLGDHTYFASHIVLSGHCVIGQRCFFGVNASVKDFVTIGDDCFISMGASVTANLPASATVLSEKGEVLSADDRRARVIRKGYFGL